jgi:hypothetical protein
MDQTPLPTTTAPLSVCPECGCGDLFVRKRFPQKVGLGLVIGAAIAFLILAARRETFYLGVAILIGVVILDLILYPFFGRTTECYRCRRNFPDAAINPEHEGFDLATAEKYRQRT